MTVTALPPDPLGRVTTVLRARQVSCRGGLTDLADAVLTVARPPAPRVAPAAVDLAELAWRRDRSAVLLDRDVLALALQDLVDAVDRHARQRTPATAAALDVATHDARDALLPPAVEG